MSQHQPTHLRLRDLDPERWRRIEALVDEALELPPERIRDFLDRACAGDPVLRAQVEAVLTADAEAGPFLQQPVLVGDPSLLEAMEEVGPPAEAIEGRRIGPWRLIREVGRGGMGAVYLAERADGQFEQRVALKLIRRGLDTDEILARFRRERQILARLEHPHIARLLDGGVTDDGLPWFAMEYVEGRPITEWCDTRRATLEERLELFGAVCAAAQHAHANLVVHRDLKPGNILVSQGGEVKLLDFGIARLLSGDGHDPGMTLTGGPLRVMTPQYAAPELVAGEPATTATDVYGLGLVLFELLAGRRAYRLEGMTPDELRRTLLEAEVEPPSRVVTRAAQGTDAQRVAAATETAGLRSTTPERLARRLRGDLDTIVLTALRKEPERRYVSVEALVEDLRRWEADLPIRARPAGRAYRLRKLMARHRVATVAVGVGLVIVLAYAVTASVLLRRAELAARRATRIQQFLTQVLGAAGPEHIGTGFEVLGSSNPEAPVREALDRAADRVDQRFADDPEVLAAVHHVIGETYLSLGLYDRAELHVRRAMTLRERHREGSDYLESLNMLAIVLNRQGRNEEALALAGRVVQLDRRLHGAEAPDVAIALQSEAAILNAMGRYDEAVERTSEGLRILRAHARPDDPRLIEVLNALASSRVGQGSFAEAESLQREVLGLVTRIYGPESRRYASALSNLGTSVYQQERYAEAESLGRTVLALRRRHLGAEHPEIATTLNGLAMAIRNQGRYAEADSLFLQAIAMRTRLLGPDHRDVLVSLSAYANLLKERGEYARAESLHRNVLARRLRVMGPDHPLVGSSLHSLGETLERERKYAAAESAYVAALALRGGLLRPDHPDTRRTRESLAKLYEVWKKPARAAAVRAATSGGR